MATTRMSLGAALAFALSSVPGAGLAAQDATALSTPIDVDGDGVAECAPGAALTPWPDAATDHEPLALVLVESRLLPVDGAGALRVCFDRYIADLRAEGWRVAAYAVECAAAEGRHQDGLTLLGLRRFVQRAQTRSGGHLAGVTLVGHFPDAYVLRTVNWRKRTARPTAQSASGSTPAVGRTHFLRRITETVAQRCDLVLADLDGGWDAVYAEPMSDYPGVVATFPSPRSRVASQRPPPPEGVPAAGGPVATLVTSNVRYADAFHLADGAVEVDEEARTVTIDDSARDAECTILDRERPNPIARPEIAVSRIDARGVAWSRGDDGKLRADPALEHALLVEYFDRNHAYRTAPVAAEAFRPASIAWGLGSGMKVLRAAAPEWNDWNEPGYDVRKNADLAALVEWFRRPAILRTIRAHSDATTAVFAKTDFDALTAALRATDTLDAKSLRRSLGKQRDRAGFTLYRAMHDHGTLADTPPYLCLHTGCEALSPPNARKHSYDAAAYGRFQHAESILFFTPCVALLGRAKVFYDEPKGFAATLAAGGTIGAAWQRYFEIESRAATWGAAGGDIGRKRSYFWSLIGDWTLRLQRPR